MSTYDKNHSSQLLRKLFTVFISAVLLVPMLTPATAVYAEAAGTSSSPEDYEVQIQEIISENGFIHPGVGLTKEILENVRTQVKVKQDPWYSYYLEMIASPSASLSASISNRSAADPTKPAVTRFDSRSTNDKMGSDAKIAYTQAILYVITGKVEYREKVMTILRLWEQMDPTKYAYFSDALIHTGHTTNRMATAAEIMRYSSTPASRPDLAWTGDDTVKLTNNLFRPIVDTFQYSNNGFMNQNNFSIVGSMAAQIFMDDREGYDDRVEWFTVNGTAENQFKNGSVKQLYREIDTNAATGEPLDRPVVQVIEMGRDQPHSADDIITASVISRLMIAQKTKVDPLTGQRSSTGNAVGPYEFLNDRILTAANYFYRYQLGYDTPWVPMEYTVSHNTGAEPKGVYYKLSEMERGRLTTAFGWDLYYYYTYIKGENVQKKAPYFYEAFTKRLPMISYWWRGWAYNAWDGYFGAGDSFWLYIPKEAAAEGSKYVPITQATGSGDPNASLVQIERSYTALDKKKSTTKQDPDGTSYISVTASKSGSRLVLVNMAYPDRASSKTLRIGLKFRSSGPATLQLGKEKTSSPYHELYLPDTGGQWRYITYDMGINTVSFGQVADNYGLVYMKVIGDSSTIVDMDHLNIAANTQLSPPLFKSGYRNADAAAYLNGTMELDLSATDSSSSDTILYSSADLPPGSSIDSGTGMFRWTPAQKGTYSFIVQATDGTTLSTKKVTVVVKADRLSAVRAAGDSYDRNNQYESAALHTYTAAYNNAIANLNSDSGSVDHLGYYKNYLLPLKSAAEGLRLLTPRLADGTMDYTSLLASSSFGNYVSLLTDNNNNTFPLENLAEDSGFTFDFGADYKISATAFAVQGRMNFVDRTAGSVVYGSNDKINWTRLTPQETAFIPGLSKIDVAPELQKERYRFIKIKKINPQPDVLGGNNNSLFEASEFRIYGQRYETKNMLTSVKLDSSDKLNGRITTGQTAQITFTAREEITDVQVKIQGTDTVLTPSADNKTITAAAAMGANVPAGELRFTIDYKGSDGTAADTAYFTTDGSKLYLVHPKEFLGVNLLATVTASDKQWGEGTLTKEQVGYLLFDGSTGTYGDLNTDSGSYYIVDFGEGSSIRLDLAVSWPRQGVAGRMNGLIIQGSNDKINWTSFNKPLTGAVDNTWNYIDVNDPGQYRYIRLYNSSSWAGNLSEVELYGEHIPSEAATADMARRITAIAAPAEGAATLALPAVPERYTLSVKSAEPAGVIGSDGRITQPDKNTLVTLILALTDTVTGKSAETPPIKTTIVGKNETKLSFAKATVTSSSAQWSNPPGTGMSGEEMARIVTDGNPWTYGDLQDANSFYMVAFGENNAVLLNRIKLFPRSNRTDRLNGMVVQGSNDAIHWTNVTPAVSGVSKAEWTDFRAHQMDQTPYRYFKLTGSGWYGNLGEFEFYGDYMTPGGRLSGPEAVADNRDFDVNYSVISVSDSVYAKSFTVNYDPDILEFTGAASLVPGTTVTASVYNTTQIKVMFDDPVLIGGGVMIAAKLSFRPLAIQSGGTSVTGNLSLAEVKLRDSLGTEFDGDKGSAYSFEISKL
ncbi:discoidin domain-containing protein [Paenibacillus sp. HW567]|uniref:discoidin domain-containing protein n=1 Tax=Paenibacillus sp. HW567 TaxID=1034769 RepID=UPI000376B54B|nr:discoidin domain-containing protein [Paenibacillus sp. HW567]